jgi:hypothetical protein
MGNIHVYMGGFGIRRLVVFIQHSDIYFLLFIRLGVWEFHEHSHIN